MSLLEQIFGYGGGDPYEDNGSFPGLQFNPAPGTKQAIQDLVDYLSKAHKDINSAQEALVGTYGDSDWTGDAADAFRMKTRALPKLLQAASNSFGGACKALSDWHMELEILQSKASAFEKQAKSARERVGQAENNPDVGLISDDGTINVPVLMSDDELARHNNAVRELNAATSQLQEIIADATSLKGQHESLAGLVASRLAAAGEQAPDEPGFFDKLMDGLVELGKGILSIQNDLVNWVKEHANAIAAVGDVLALVSTAIGFIGMACDLSGFGIVGAPLGGIAAGFSALALVSHGAAKAAGADVSNATLTWDGLGIISGGVGSAALEDGGKLLHAIPKIVGTERGITGTGTAVTVAGLIDDHGALKNFRPQNEGQRAVSVGGIAPLFIALQNAWNSGSEKDK
ncbi:putative T7SS-secreted protein [Streptomyces sp. NPDC021749]|uniref:putative T7SS-secreted protein n=1 Tax=Streptomyces sp. NPDC021749 TaxID=3154905 RepID=UPI0033E9DD1C